MIEMIDEELTAVIEPVSHNKSNLDENASPDNLAPKQPAQFGHKTFENMFAQFVGSDSGKKFAKKVPTFPIQLKAKKQITAIEIRKPVLLEVRTE
jgi:hypothetical protein